MTTCWQRLRIRAPQLITMKPIVFLAAYLLSYLFDTSFEAWLLRHVSTNTQKILTRHSSCRCILTQLRDKCENLKTCETSPTRLSVSVVSIASLIVQHCYHVGVHVSQVI